MDVSEENDKLKDDVSNDFYCHHEESQSTIWERPGVNMEETNVLRTQNDISMDNSDNQSLQSLFATAKEETIVSLSTDESKATLPNGWVEVTEPQSNEICHFHEASGRTT